MKDDKTEWIVTNHPKTTIVRGKPYKAFTLFLEADIVDHLHKEKELTGIPLSFQVTNALRQYWKSKNSDKE